MKEFRQFYPPASPEGEADGGQATKGRRALSTARDGGQERYHKFSIFKLQYQFFYRISRFL
ncbi:MAG: hypothetical protein KKG97_01945, partial [Proteobacteria bacterium]|nr:hypothetical protein [Pseudomonadota bacterium]